MRRKLIPLRLNQHFGFGIAHCAGPRIAFAACCTATTMRGCVPQRHMLPCNDCAISAADGVGFFCSSATLLMIMPEVQYAHWKAPASRNASCTGCSAPSFSSPSMVVMDFPAASPTGNKHERLGVPSTSTVHAPHCPSPQPYLLPVSP